MTRLSPPVIELLHKALRSFRHLQHVHDAPVALEAGVQLDQRHRVGCLWNRPRLCLDACSDPKM